jgi:hypothetical protein
MKTYIQIEINQILVNKKIIITKKKKNKYLMIKINDIYKNFKIIFFLKILFVFILFLINIFLIFIFFNLKRAKMMIK